MMNDQILSEANELITGTIRRATIIAGGKQPEECGSKRKAEYDLLEQYFMLQFPVLVNRACREAEFDLLPKDTKVLVEEINRLRKGIDEIEQAIEYYLEHDQELLTKIKTLKAGKA